MPVELLPGSKMLLSKLLQARPSLPYPYTKYLGPQVFQMSELFRFCGIFICVMCIYGGVASQHEAHLCFVHTEHTKPEKLLTAYVDMQKF